MTQIREILSKRPAIHLFYKATFLQEPIFLSDGVAAIPYEPFNPDLERYFQEYLGVMQIKYDVSQLNASVEASRQRNAGLIIVIPIDAMVGDPDKDEKINLAIDRTEDVFSWATEDRLDLVGAVILNPDPGDTKYYLQGSNSRQRLRLGPGNVGSSFVDSIEALRQCQLTDEHFSFLLTIARDALHEPRVTFRIAKYFSCLEGLASALKNKNTYEKLSAKLGKTPELNQNGTVGSRSAVKLLISWQNHIS